MASFRSDNQNALLEHSPIPKSDQADYHEWSKRFARASIDEWAGQQPDKPSRSEALRRLASTALASQEPVATAAPFVGLRLPAELLDVVGAWAASKILTRPASNPRADRRRGRRLDPAHQAAPDIRCIGGDEAYPQEITWSHTTRCEAGFK